jgi:PAS domain S-box-containing protein
MSPDPHLNAPWPRSEHAYRAIFEQSALGMGFIGFADARSLDVNNAFCQMVWRSRDDVLSMSWPDLTHPDDLEVDLIPFRRMARGEIDSYQVEKRLLHKKGHEVWVKMTLSLTRDANGNADFAVAIIEDIRERKSAEHELMESKAQLEAERARLQVILDTIPTGLIMLDENGAMALENAEWKRTWAGNALLNSVVDYESYKGYRPETGERIAAAEWPCAVSLKQGIQTRDVILDIERFNGTRGTIVVSSSPIRDDAGRVIGAVAANMDITELRTAQMKLLEADRRKDEFLAMLAHELRNPLAPISAAAEMLRMVAHGDAKVIKASEVIGRQVRHMSALLDDLLDVSRVTRGLVELNKAVVELNAIVDSAVEQSRPLLISRNHTLAVQAHADHVAVNGDRNRLVQVVVNLLNNAAKYTPEGGTITLSIRNDLNHAFIDVEDNGIGIESELLPDIFDLFTQAERTPDRSQGGLGIGLALVKTILTLHGGEITACSAGQGAGSKFTVSLPLASRSR